MQAMITALADLPLQLAIAGLPANLTVYSARAVPGYTLVSQVPPCPYTRVQQHQFSFGLQDIFSRSPESQIA